MLLSYTHDMNNTCMYCTLHTHMHAHERVRENEREREREGGREGGRDTHAHMQTTCILNVLGTAVYVHTDRQIVRNVTNKRGYVTTQGNAGMGTNLA